MAIRAASSGGMANPRFFEHPEESAPRRLETTFLSALVAAFQAALVAAF